MTILDATSKAHADNAQALIEEARRHQRGRRRWMAGAVVLAAVLSWGTYAIVSGTGGGGLHAPGKVAAPLLVGLLANSRSYRDCPGSAQVGPATSADGLPAEVSRTDDLSFVKVVAKNMTSSPYLGFTHRIVGMPDYRGVSAIRVGPGGGYVWTRNPSGQVEVVHVKNYGIYVYLRALSECPTGGWARLADGGVQVTFLAPKG